MQEIFEKIIQNLKEQKSGLTEWHEDKAFEIGIEKAIEIVKQVAAEYNNLWIPADEPPKDDNFVLLSFENFSLPMVGRYEADGEGGGAYYIGDCDGTDTCIANDLIVDAWQPLPPRYNPDGEKHEKKTKYDQIRSMSDEEMAEFLCKVKADYQWLEHEFPSEEDYGDWVEWLQSEVEE